MTELFDAIYVDPNDNDENMRGLINELGDAAADYCFDEAWLEYLSEEARVKKTIRQKSKKALNVEGDMRSIAIACAAIEIGEALEEHEYRCGYTRDGGAVQNGVHGLLMRGDISEETCANCKDHCSTYSRDRLTNFGFTLRMCIHFLENGKTLETSKDFEALNHRYSCDTNAGRGHGNNCRKAELFIKGFKMYRKALGVAYRNGIPLDALYDLNSQMDRFATRSSSLGNYGCIPFELKVVPNKFFEENFTKCNTPKEGFFLVLVNEKNYVYMNDQFAPFLDFDWYKWCEAQKHGVHIDIDSEESGKIERWKKDALVECGEGYYRQASWYYKQTFVSPTQRERIANFTEYLRCVNDAIELRSKLIVEKVEEKTQKKGQETQ